MATARSESDGFVPPEPVKIVKDPDYVPPGTPGTTTATVTTPTPGGGATTTTVTQGAPTGSSEPTKTGGILNRLGREGILQEVLIQATNELTTEVGESKDFPNEFVPRMAKVFAAVVNVSLDIEAENHPRPQNEFVELGPRDVGADYDR